jgi:hypothetical protein
MEKRYLREEQGASISSEGEMRRRGWNGEMKKT